MEPSTPAPTVTHDRPAVDVSQPSVSSADSQFSEYEQHKIARGFMPEPKVPEVKADPAPEVKAEPKPAAETPANPLAAAPEPDEAPETPDAPDPADVKPPEQGANHRWKDPDTGITLDLRRRDHRRIKKALEDRYALAQRLMQQPAPQPQTPPQTPQAAQAQTPQVDPKDPEPTLDQFADQPDPYTSYIAAQARWHARQEHQKLTAERTSVERARQMQAQIDSAQQAFDARTPEITQRYPDFDAAYQELHDTLSRVGKRATPLVKYLLTSPIGHEVTYYLGNHPEEVARLYSVPSLDAHLRAIGAIEARVQSSLTAAPAQASTTRAPAPTTPVNTGGPAVRRDAGQIAQEGDYQAWRATRGMPATAATAVR